jgi:hypothetical protein
MRFLEIYIDHARQQQNGPRENRGPWGSGGRRSHDAVIRVYDEAGNVIETHEHAGDFKEW